VIVAEGPEDAEGVRGRLEPELRPTGEWCAVRDRERLLLPNAAEEMDGDDE